MSAIKRVTINNKSLVCQFCGHDEFFVFETKLNERWLVILDAEIFSKKGKAFICQQCGYKHEFFSPNPSSINF